MGEWDDSVVDESADFDESVVVDEAIFDVTEDVTSSLSSVQPARAADAMIVVSKSANSFFDFVAIR